MYISLNNITEPESLLTFTDVPNILKLDETVTGTNARLTFTFQGNLQGTVSANSQYYLTILGETVYNTMSPNNAQNKRFYIAGDNVSTAASFAKALRNCGSLNADFNIQHSGSSVVLVAKTVGSKLGSDYLQRNIPSEYLQASGTEGTTSSNVMNSQISVDVTTDEQYVTTLTKNWYGDYTAFNLSPVLTTIAEYGTTRNFELAISMVGNDGTWSSLGDMAAHVAVGYKANNSADYLEIEGQTLLLNGTEFYYYGNTIPVTFLCDANTMYASADISIKDSALNEIYSGSTTYRKQLGNYFVDAEIEIPAAYRTLAYYVDITTNGNTYRFNTIKPIKMAEGYTRLCWRNEYGGISFFDFTGKYSESDKLSTETFEKSLFDYYDVTDAFQLKKVYDRDVQKTITVTSHLISKEGAKIFNSLAKSKSVWTYDEQGNKKYVIISSVSVQEDNNYNDVFTGTVQFNYSYE